MIVDAGGIDGTVADVILILQTKVTCGICPTGTISRQTFVLTGINSKALSLCEEGRFEAGLELNLLWGINCGPSSRLLTS